MDFLVSTGTFEREKTLAERLSYLDELGVTGVELSGGQFQSNWLDDLRNFRFNRWALHNFFPPPDRPFVFNLASSDEDLRQTSINFAKAAIDICSDHGVPYWSFHAGFALDPSPEDLGKDVLSGRNFQGVESMKSNFLASSDKILSYASERKVSLLVENNVLTSGTSSALGSQSLLAVDVEGAKSIVDYFGGQLRFLLDTGHLKVSCETLGLDFDSELGHGLEVASGVHLHDNDGVLDQHLNPDRGLCERIIERKTEELMFLTLEVQPSLIPETLEMLEDLGFVL